MPISNLENRWSSPSFYEIENSDEEKQIKVGTTPLRPNYGTTSCTHTIYLLLYVVVITPSS
jgi:hypothetical protein